METVATMTTGVTGEVRAQARTVRVWCVVPWHSRSEEVEALLRDLAELEVEGELANGESVGLRVQVVVVDNASAEVVRLPEVGANGVTFEAVRLEDNRGGSGGFNAGIGQAIEECGGGSGTDAYVWLVDSDARVSPGALMELVRVLEARPDLCAAGSAIADPETGRVFEVGATIDRRTGALRAACAGAAGTPSVVGCDYVASCSALVRLSCARACGPMPDLFLHGDDAAWFVHMRRVTGKGVVGVASSVVYHPRFDRFALRGRYFAARNGFAPLRELGLGKWVALRRGVREVGRAVQQELMGRSDLSRLHVDGLRDAADGVIGAGCGLKAKIEPFRPMGELGDALKPLLADAGSWRAVVEGEKALGLSDAEYQGLCAELGRAGVHVASEGEGRAWRVVHAGAKGAGLLRGAGLIQIAPGVRGGGREPGFVVRTGDVSMVAWRAMWTGCAALRQALRVARRWESLRTPAPGVTVREPSRSESGTATLSIVVVSYNRWSALRGTLERLRSMAGLNGAEVIVVDNASTDGSAEMVEKEFPEVGLIRAGHNGGVSAFNRGVEAASGDIVLVLDDDSWPDVGALEKSLALMSRLPQLGAVALHPRHPLNGKSEWRCAAHVETPRDDWPIMGCGNMVRRSAWREVGGYEEGFFLYRNDVDLALKLLAAGYGVHFDPSLTVWHDSPAAARKSVRWHRTATRNWIWLAKRHGRGLGLGGMLGGAIGWLWAHRLAGWSLSRQWATVRGMVEGLRRSAPTVARRRGAKSDGHFERMVRLSMKRSDLVG